MKRVTVKVDVPKSEATLRFDYERILFIDFCRCPAGLFDNIRFKLARTMAERNPKMFVAFTDPSLMTPGECEHMMESVVSCYKSGYDVLVVATTEIYLEWMRCMQYQHKLKVTYATVDVSHGDGMETKIDVIRPKAVRGKKRSFESFDGKTVHGLTKPFTNLTLELVKATGACRMKFYKSTLSKVHKALRKLDSNRKNASR